MLVFRDVMPGEFFLDEEGNCCQKCTSRKYVLISDKDKNNIGVIVSCVSPTKPVRMLENGE